ncbi:hypothetical protein SAMN04515667_1874 [Formosa sp. Hel1_31_208]|uniref:DUF6503 family protein n=1 Tax=Formosa sp. Hel1_31_208 TaxID=1798225 RepID=UPI00087ADD4D|nr:DUF6503 family protein [Formosa sp. Hel1_31_208]SDS30559.1 hypothetical protein SAMN04515667_1874 [Formosa sp. Hel1_31_208]
MNYLMKLKGLVVFVLMMLTSCKSDKSVDAVTSIDYANEELDVTTSTYPETMTKVFDAHGGIDAWNQMKSLSFSMEKPDGVEVTTTNLKTRAERIDSPSYSMGFDGETLWVNEKTGKAYNGNARFYKGLYMYFYAMPFIFGDDGIIYEEAKPLVFEGKSYPGILISYETGIGESSHDQYIVYYDAESGQMAWLGYTVTFGKEEKSKDFHFIKYSQWQTVNGVVLPKRLDWYNYENNLPTEKRNSVEFINVVVSETAPDSSLFTMIEGARVIE